MNHLTKFSNEAQYNAQKGTLVLPNVSLITNINQLRTLDKPAHFLDYLHNTGVVDDVASSDVIGICVIPESHYGKARFMSVVNMSTSSTSGTTGTSQDAYIKWKTNNDGNANLRQTNQVVGMDLLGGSFTIEMDDNWHAICTDRLHGGYKDEGIVENLTIPKAWDQTAIYWYNDGDSDNRYCPSPFLANGLLNPDYCKPWPNALSDVDGITNTKTLLAKSTTNYPAAKACRDFSPGYRNGDWYLPAIGELAYLQVRWGAINSKLAALQSAGCSVALLPEDGILWSSSEYSNDDSWRLDTYGGSMNSNNKGFNELVRAFLA